MKSIYKLLGAACLIGGLAASTTIPAQAQDVGLSFGIGSFGMHSGWNDNHRSDWRWRNRHSHRSSGFSISIDLPRVVVSSSHARRCDNRYLTYDRFSDTYMGFDGDRHRCRL